MPTVAAIMVSYQTGPRLKDCLAALAAADAVTAIVIVDNGNPPEMVRWLTEFCVRIVKAEYVAPDRNVGFGTAVNVGARHRTEDYFLAINPDAMIRHDALPALLQTATTAASPVIVGGRLFGPDGQPQAGPRRRRLTLKTLWSAMLGGPGLTLSDAPADEGAAEAVGAVSGGFFLIDRAGFDAIGGFDEAYFLHVEDIDLCERVRRAGGQVLFEPRAGAMHDGATSRVSNLIVERHKAAGFAHYFRKFSRGPFHRLLVEFSLPVLRLGLWLRARRAPR